MKATHKRKLLNGDIANLSIGQGDTEVTPLQMAQAIATVANGGTLFQTRLIHQIQTYDNEIVNGYQVRAKRTLDISPETQDLMRKGLIDAVNAPTGTAHAASMDNVDVAGKTGTAQWGPKNKERTAAWFAGFLPANQPQYAFAALYEGDVGSKEHGGTTAAPMIGEIFKQLYKGQAKARTRRASPVQTAPRAEPVEDDQSD
jgi:penicillin-binding protein 2